MTAIKICGLTRKQDALACVELGVDALGLNFWSGSPRRCTEAQARAIVGAVGERVRLIAVLVDPTSSDVRRLRRELGLRWVQLHGDEPAELVTALGPESMKAVRLGGPADVPMALEMVGDEVLVDARVTGLPGGTGAPCDWDAAAVVAERRKVWLAGGLRPDNVAEAVRRVRPFGVDVASGVESAPGEKDLERVASFVHAVRSA